MPQDGEGSDLGFIFSPRWLRDNDICCRWYPLNVGDVYHVNERAPVVRKILAGLGLYGVVGMILTIAGLARGDSLSDSAAYGFMMGGVLFGVVVLLVTIVSFLVGVIAGE